MTRVAFQTRIVNSIHSRLAWPSVSWTVTATFPRTSAGSRIASTNRLWSSTRIDIRVYVVRVVVEIDVMELIQPPAGDRVGLQSHAVATGIAGEHDIQNPSGREPAAPRLVLSLPVAKISRRGFDRGDDGVHVQDPRHLGLAQDPCHAGENSALAMSALNVGLIGLGTVGARVAERMLTWQPQLARRAGVELCLRRVLVRDVDKPRSVEAAALRRVSSSAFRLASSSALRRASSSALRWASSSAFRLASSSAWRRASPSAFRLASSSALRRASSSVFRFASLRRASASLSSL